MKPNITARIALRYLFVPLFLLLGSLSSLLAAGTASISGQVTSAGTSPPYPVAGVQITLVRHGSQMTTHSDVNGNYSFTGLSAGEYGLKLEVRHISHLDKDGDVDLPAGGNATANVSIIPRLSLTPLCSADPSVSRHWSVHNPLPVPVNFTWVLVHPSNKTGSGIASPGNSTFDTPAVNGDNRVRILVSQVVVDEKANHGEICPSGSLSGLVTDNSGAPLGNVHIVITEDNGNTITTVFSKADGSYSAANLPVATYSLAFSETGYISRTVTGIQVSFGRNTDVPAVQLTPIAPPPLATVNVEVLESDTQAGISGVSVVINYSSGASVAGITDGNGLCQFTGQPTGVPATVTVTVNDGSGRTGSATSPGFASGHNAVTITLPPILQGSISGTVTDTNNAPLGGVAVNVLDPSNNTIASGATLANGNYSIGGIPAGTYSMSFTLSGYFPVVQPGVVVAPGSNTVQNAALTPVGPPPTATVSVTVLETDTPPLPIVSATVQVTYAGTNISAIGSTDGNGTAQFTGQPVNVAATITVTVNDAFGRTATQTVTGGFAAGPNSVTIGIAPVPKGSISGTVIDSDISPTPLSGVAVSVLDSGNNTVASGTSLSDGSYSIGGITAGTYTLTFALSSYQTATVPDVTVLPGSNTTENVTLTNLFATVNVTITDFTGTPIPGAAVMISYNDGTVAGPLTTDGNGFVSFTGQEIGVAATISAQWSDPVSGMVIGSAADSFNGFAPGINPVTVSQVFTD